MSSIIKTYGEWSNRTSIEIKKELDKAIDNIGRDEETIELLTHSEKIRLLNDKVSQYEKNKKNALDGVRNKTIFGFNYDIIAFHRAATIIEKIKDGEFSSAKEYIDGEFWPNTMLGRTMKMVLMFSKFGPKFYEEYYGYSLMEPEVQYLEEIKKINTLLDKGISSFEKAVEEVSFARYLIIKDGKKEIATTIVLDENKENFVGMGMENHKMYIVGTIFDNTILFTTRGSKQPRVNYQGSLKEEKAVVDGEDRTVEISLKPILGFCPATADKIRAKVKPQVMETKRFERIKKK